MGNEKPDDSKKIDPSLNESGINIQGLVDEVDENAQTVLFQRAINPDDIKALTQEAEETKIIHAVAGDAAKAELSEDELNRIVDEVGVHGALPMDDLPSSVKKDDSEDKKE